MEQAAAQRLLIAFVPQPNQMTKMHRRVAAATTTRIFAGATLLLLVVHCSGSAWTPASPPNRGWGSIPTQRQLDLGTFSLVLATISTASSSSSSVLRASSQPQSPSGDASPSSLVRQGMTAFRQGQVAESIAYFDKAEQLSYSYSLTPYLWQRGLSYFYTNDFEAASRQFRTDVRVNPNDTEEIVWDIASQLRQQQQRIGSGSSTGATAMSVFPIPNQLSLPSGTKDGRKIMVSSQCRYAPD